MKYEELSLALIVIASNAHYIADDASGSGDYLYQLLSHPFCVVLVLAKDDGLGTLD